MQEPWSRAGPALGEILESLGPDIVTLAVPAAGPEHQILGPRIFDEVVPASVGPGDLVLAAGARDLVVVVQEAAARGAAGVVVKSAPPEVIERARLSGIALVVVTSALSWDQLHMLVRNAVAAHGAPAAHGDAVSLGDLFALANAVAAMVGGAVTIEDPQSNLLAYSSLDHRIDEPRRQTILGRRVPDPWTKRLRDEGIWREMWSSPGVVRFEDPTAEAQPRLAVAIRAGSEPLGSIWVIEGDQPLGSDAERALAEAARIAALHVLRHRAAEDVDRRERATLLRLLLDGRTAAGDDGAEQLGIEPDSHCAVMGFRLLLDDEAELDLKRERTIDLITVYCEAFRRRAVCVAVGRDVYALLPSLDPDSRVIALASDIAAHAAAALGTPLVVGVGSTVATLAEAPQSRQEADRVLDVIEASPPGTIAHIDDVRVRSTLREVVAIVRRRPDLRLPALESLTPTYVETLRAYLDAFGDVPAAAANIGLHPNSFRYRLRRLGEVAAIDLADPETRVLLGLLLRLD